VVKFAITSVVCFALSLAACGEKSHSYDSKVRISRVDTVRSDENGQPLLVDVEFDWEACPGEQLEVIRGSAEFAKCIAKHHVGEELPVKVEHRKLSDGHWDWDVHQLGDCARPPDIHDESSFDMVQECRDIEEHDVVVGFECDREPHPDVLAACPWFQRQ
jgi:hypothetical protein